MADQNENMTDSQDVQRDAQGAPVEAPQKAQGTPEGDAQPEAKPNDAEKYKREVERLRADNRKLKNEAAERRVTAKQAQEQNEQLRKVAQALGLETQDDDPEVLLKTAREQAEENKREADKLRAELDRMRESDELRRIAREAGADPEVMVPFLVGSGTLPKWGEDDYTTQAVEVVKSALERHPAFGVHKVPQSSGQAPTPVKRDGEARLSQDDIQRLVAQGDYQAVNDAVAAGRVEL